MAEEVWAPGAGVLKDFRILLFRPEKRKDNGLCLGGLLVRLIPLLILLEVLGVLSIAGQKAPMDLDDLIDRYPRRCY